MNVVEHRTNNTMFEGVIPSSPQKKEELKVSLSFQLLLSQCFRDPKAAGKSLLNRFNNLSTKQKQLIFGLGIAVGGVIATIAISRFGSTKETQENSNPFIKTDLKSTESNSELVDGHISGASVDSGHLSSRSKIDDIIDSFDIFSKKEEKKASHLLFNDWVRSRKNKCANFLGTISNKERAYLLELKDLTESKHLTDNFIQHTRDCLNNEQRLDAIEHIDFSKVSSVKDLRYILSETLEREDYDAIAAGKSEMQSTLRYRKLSSEQINTIMNFRDEKDLRGSLSVLKDLLLMQITDDQLTRYIQKYDIDGATLKILVGNNKLNRFIQNRFSQNSLTWSKE